MTRLVNAPRLVRRNYGRTGHGYTFEGEKWPGVTTIISGGVPKSALYNWYAREAAEYAADHLDAIVQLADRDAIVDLVKNAGNRDRDAAAGRGTLVHNLAQQLTAGAEVEIPEELTGHVDSYIKWYRDWDVQPVLVETAVANTAHRYAGTLDLVACVRRYDPDSLCLLELKTGRSGIFGETALQLAAYACCDIAVVDGRERPMPEVTHTLAVWLRADGYDMYTVDADAAAYRVFRHAQAMHAWFEATPSSLIGAALAPPRQEAAS